MYMVFVQILLARASSTRSHPHTYIYVYVCTIKTSALSPVNTIRAFVSVSVYIYLYCNVIEYVFAYLLFALFFVDVAVVCSLFV